MALWLLRPRFREQRLSTRGTLEAPVKSEKAASPSTAVARRILEDVISYNAAMSACEKAEEAGSLGFLCIGFKHLRSKPSLDLQQSLKARHASSTRTISRDDLCLGFCVHAHETQICYTQDPKRFTRPKA